MAEGNDANGAVAGTERETALGTAAPADDKATPPTDVGAKPQAGDGNGGVADQKTEAQTAAAKALADAKTPEEKAAAEKAVRDADEAAKAAKKPAGAPEKYEDFKFPEGVTPDGELLTKFHEIGKKHGFSQETAQALIDFHGEQLLKANSDLQKSWDATVEGWLAEAKADKDIGGAKYDENLAHGKNALKAFNASPKFMDMLNATGVGNHPEMIRFLSAVGRAVADDKFHLGGSNAADPNSEEARLARIYPNHK